VLEVWIRLENLLLGIAGRKKISDQRDPNPRTPNTGFAKTDIRINRNSIHPLHVVMLSALFVPRSPASPTSPQPASVDKPLQVVLDSVAVGTGQDRGFAHRHPSVLEDDAEEFFRERRHWWHEPLPFDLPLEDLLLPQETPNEKGQPVDQLRLIPIQRRLGAAQRGVLLVLAVFDDSLEGGIRDVAVSGPQ